MPALYCKYLDLDLYLDPEDDDDDEDEDELDELEELLGDRAFLFFSLDLLDIFQIISWSVGSS